MPKQSIYLARLSVMLLAGALLMGGCKNVRKYLPPEIWNPKDPGGNIVAFTDDDTILPPPPMAEMPGANFSQLPYVELPPVPDISQYGYDQFDNVSIGLADDPREEPTGRVSGLQTVSFAYDSAELSLQARQILNQNVLWLKENRSYEVRVEGHCDEQGAATYNLALGQHRASAVREYLATQGIDPASLHVMSFGEERPIATGHNEDAYRQNRRAQFFVYE